MSDEPRIAPLERDEWPESVKDMLSLRIEDADTALGDNNIFSTLARHPDLFRPWMRFAGYLLTAGTLSARDRELLILRTGFRCGSSYEWGQHVRLSLRLGIERETIDRVLAGPETDGWTPHEAALLRAVDELHDDSKVSDATWERLRETYDERQLIEAVMLVGQYHLVAFSLNSLGVALDEGLEPLP
jgi:4-carboxymuconolactone decarboxylase